MMKSLARIAPQYKKQKKTQETRTALLKSQKHNVHGDDQAGDDHCDNRGVPLINERWRHARHRTRHMHQRHHCEGQRISQNNLFSSKINEATITT